MRSNGKGLMLLAALLFCAACDSEVKLSDGKEYDCIGLGADRDPRLRYKIDKSNMVVGIIFIETIVVPIVVAADEFYCPVGFAPTRPAEISP